MQQQRAYDVLPSVKKSKAAEPAHTEGYQEMAHPAAQCMYMCFYQSMEPTEACEPASQSAEA